MGRGLESRLQKVWLKKPGLLEKRILLEQRKRMWSLLHIFERLS